MRILDAGQVPIYLTQDCGSQSPHIVIAGSLNPKTSFI